MQFTKVRDIMTFNPVLIGEDATLQEAAEKMEKNDCGALPVGSGGADLEGVITDRDIVVRAIAKGKNPAEEKVCDYMTSKVYSCKESNTLQEAADIMHKYQVSRLIVKNDDDNVSGILSFGAILRKDASTSEIAEVVSHATGSKRASA